MPKPTSERDIVMVLVVVSHLQKRSALQAEKANDFELGKTTAGFLFAILRPLVGDLAFELLGHLGANLLEHCLIEPCASLTVAAGIRGRRALTGKMHLPPSANSLQSITTGGAAL